MLLTDGVNTAGMLEPVQAAELARAHGVRVHTVASGGIGGGLSMFGFRMQVPGGGEAIDEDTLQAVAEATGGRMFRARDAAELAGHRHTAIGIDIDLPYAVTNASLDFFDRHAIGLWHLTTVAVDDVLQFLRHGGRTMHDEMRVRQPPIDLFDDMHRQDLAIGLAGKLVGPVRCATCNRKRIDTGTGDKINGLVRIGQELIMRQFPLGTMAVLGFTGTALQ